MPRPSRRRAIPFAVLPVPTGRGERALLARLLSWGRGEAPPGPALGRRRAGPPSPALTSRMGVPRGFADREWGRSPHPPIVPAPRLPAGPPPLRAELGPPAGAERLPTALGGREATQDPSAGRPPGAKEGAPRRGGPGATGTPPGGPGRPLLRRASSLRRVVLPAFLRSRRPRARKTRREARGRFVPALRPRISPAREGAGRWGGADSRRREARSRPLEAGSGRLARTAAPPAPPRLSSGAPVRLTPGLFPTPSGVPTSPLRPPPRVAPTRLRPSAARPSCRADNVGRSPPTKPWPRWKWLHGPRRGLLLRLLPGRGARKSRSIPARWR
jgi:hypothetical protein